MVSKILNKLFIAVTLFFIVRGITYSETHFSGFTGIKGDFCSEKGEDTFTPCLNVDAFFAGQLDFGKNVFMRSELSVSTANIINGEIFDGTDSLFALNELSFTFRKSISRTANYFSLFLGTYEPIGSDVFLQRHFGIESVSSKLTNNWIGLNGSYVFPFYGMGGSYVLHFEAVPIATGLYVYYNKKTPDEAHQLNFDLRFATVWRYLTLDVSGGIGVPLENKSSAGDDVILLVDTVYLHLGLNALVGNSYTKAAVLLQGGFSTFPVHGGNNELEARDIHMILEPRFNFGKVRLNVSLYSLPKELLRRTLFLEDTFGLDLNLYGDKIPIRNKDLTFGLHALLSFTGLNFLDVGKIGDAFMDDGYTIKIAPYTAVPLFGGTFNAMFQVNISNLIYGNGVEWMKLNLGYKRQI